MKLFPIKHDRTGLERMQRKGIKIQNPPRFRIGTEINLKPAIEQKILHPVSPHPSSHAITRFDHPHRNPCFMETQGTTQTRQTCAHNQHW